MTVAILPEIVWNSLRPLGEEVRRKRPQLSPEQLQDTVTGLSKVVDLLRDFWQLQRQRIKRGVELKGFLETLRLFDKCVEEAHALLDLLSGLGKMASVNIEQSVELTHERADEVGKEVAYLLARLESVTSPRELPSEVRQGMGHAEGGNYERGDEIIARLERGEEL